MPTKMTSVAAMCVLGLGIASAAATAKAAPERYLHVKVEQGAKGESVNINVPLSMAEKILPAIHQGNLNGGRVTIGQSDINGIDIRTVLDAIRTAPDNEFVTVQQKDQNVRVLKSNGNIVVKVHDPNKGGEQVDVTVPLKVVDALFSTAKDNELDVAAAIHALDDAGESLLVTVEDASQHVRIWVDSRSTQ
ncbi:MAG: hypothetical protein WBS18_04750 [Candidatus Acidiferrales bacterium]